MFFQRLGVFRARHDDLLHGGEIIQQHHAVSVVDWRPAHDFFVLQVNHAFDNVFAIEHGDVRLARAINHRAVQLEIPHFGLFRFRQRDLGKTGIGFKIRRGFDDLDGLFNFVCGQRVQRVRALLHLEGLIKPRLEHIIDEGVGDKRFFTFHHHRHLQCERFAVDDGGFRARFNLNKSAVFAEGEHLGVIVPLHISAKVRKCLVHWNHMRFAAVGENR
ncbi:hypothetical protein D3C71_972670 [compost metagenome]